MLGAYFVRGCDQPGDDLDVLEELPREELSSVSNKMIR
jgi:hypothetical protein